MRTLVLGDVEAAWDLAEKVIKKAIKDQGPVDHIIQVGDMNFGAARITPWKDPPDFGGLPMSWIDGNHDNHRILQGKEQVPEEWESFLKVWDYKKRGTIEKGILYIGGAKSIDRNNRITGLDWWDEENISYEEEGIILDAIRSYGSENIHTVITHEAPSSFDVSPILRSGHQDFDHNRNFLDHVRDLIKPLHWFFGHYHRALTGETEGCVWRCVGLVDTGDYAVIDL